MTTGPLPPAAARPRRPRDMVWLCLFGTLAGAAVVALATVLFGHVTGEEFCPSTFARRSFHYLEIPLLHVQVSPISRSDATQTLERTLQSQGYIPAAPVAPARAESVPPRLAPPRLPARPPWLPPHWLPARPPW